MDALNSEKDKSFKRDDMRNSILGLVKKSGLCITEEVFPDFFLVSIDGESLPADPKKRLKALFEIKKKWNLEDIRPLLM